MVSSIWKYLELRSPGVFFGTIVLVGMIQDQEPFFCGHDLFNIGVVRHGKYAIKSPGLPEPSEYGIGASAGAAATPALSRGARWHSS
jgi:hypothetical protein